MCPALLKPTIHPTGIHVEPFASLAEYDVRPLHRFGMIDVQRFHIARDQQSLVRAAVLYIEPEHDLGAEILDDEVLLVP